MSLTRLLMFGGIPEDHLKWAMQYFEEVGVDFGTHLISEGETDASMLIIVDGQLSMTTGGVELGTASKGDLVGEVALFGAGVRSANVESLTQANLLVLSRQRFLELRDTGSPVAYTIELFALDFITERLRRTNQQIARLSEGTTEGEVTMRKGIFGRLAAALGADGMGGSPVGLNKLAALQASSLFSDAPKEVLAKLAEEFTGASADPGTYVINEGDRGDDMFLIVEGAVDVIVDVDGRLVEGLATLQVGDAFGMGSLVDRTAQRMASCVTSGHCKFLMMDAFTFMRVSRVGDAVGSVLRTAMVRALAQQLAYSNGQLAMLEMTHQRATTGSFDRHRLRAAAAAMEAHGSYLNEESSPES